MKKLIVTALFLTACLEPDSKTVTVKDARTKTETSVTTQSVSDADFAALQKKVGELEMALTTVQTNLAAAKSDIASHTAQIASLAVGGGLTIGTVLYGSYIISNSMDVAFLNPVTWVTGSLRISSDGMTNISLPNLSGTGSDLDIFVTDPMKDVALSALTHVGGSLSVYSEPYTGAATLISLELSALTSVGRNLYIRDNAVTSLAGLSGLTSVGAGYSTPDTTSAVGGIFSITSNDALTNLGGLSNLTNVRILSINSNAALTSLGLSSLTGSVMGFDVSYNPSLCQSLVTALRGQVTNTGGNNISGNNTGC